MTQTTVPDTLRSIARCRVIFSVIALVSLCIDPVSAVLPRWLALSGEPLAIDPRALIIMGGHLAYSLTVYYLFVHRAAAPSWLAAITIWNDTLFAAAIALCTHATNSPFYAFFIFAV